MVQRWLHTTGSHRSSWAAAALQPLYGIALMDGGNGKSSRRAELQATHLVMHSAWRYKRADVQIHEPFVKGHSGTWKECDWKFGDKATWGRGVWTEQTRDMKMPVSCVIAHQKVASVGEDSHNQVDSMAHSVGSRQALAPANPGVTCWTHGERGHGGRDGGSVWAQHGPAPDPPEAETCTAPLTRCPGPGLSVSYAAAGRPRQAPSMMEEAVLRPL